LIMIRNFLPMKSNLVSRHKLQNRRKFLTFLILLVSLLLTLPIAFGSLCSSNFNSGFGNSGFNSWRTNSGFDEFNRNNYNNFNNQRPNSFGRSGFRSSALNRQTTTYTHKTKMWGNNLEQLKQDKIDRFTRVYNVNTKSYETLNRPLSQRQKNAIARIDARIKMMTDFYGG